MIILRFFIGNYNNGLSLGYNELKEEKTIVSNVTEATQPPQEEIQDFTVIGSGVIGLLVAHELASEGHNVKVVSAQGKPTANTDSTSSVAVGQFLPWLPETHTAGVLGNLDLEEVVAGTRHFYEELSQNSHETGVMSVENVELVSSSSPWPAGLPEAMQTTPEKLEKPVSFLEPDGSETALDTAYTFNTFSINTRKTVAYLAQKAEDEGVIFEQRQLTANDLESLEGVIVNAAGMGASQFDKTGEVNNYKGHTFVLRPDPGVPLPKQAVSVEDLVMMPREDGTLVCGALYIENPDRPVPEEQEADALRARLGKLFKEVAPLVDGLDPDILEKSETIVHSAGYRVEQAGGDIRIAPDETNKRLLHAYGFAGIGWSVGPHLAHTISDMAKSLSANKET